jgi:hypothetical protein
MFLVPAITIFGGFAIAGGTTIHQERPPSKEDASKGPPETWAEE